MQRFLGILLIAGGLLSAAVFATDLVGRDDGVRAAADSFDGTSARVEAIAGLAVSLVCGVVGFRLARTPR